MNVASGVEMTSETVMHIGSITKIVNTTLLMQMVDDGLVDLDAPVSRYLPELRLADPDHLARITVAMLVNHTSGIDGELLPDHGPDEETIAKAIPRFADMGKVHEPGADTSYCNTATVIAGYLCQRIRERSWYDLVKERVFAPLGLEHAVVLPEDALLHRPPWATSPIPRRAQPVRTSFAFLPKSFAPAGATAMMSARDLATFAAAHMGDDVGPNGAAILSPNSARAMRTETTRARGQGAPIVFGLGWMLLDGGFVAHSGGGPGILASLVAHPESTWRPQCSRTLPTAPRWPASSRTSGSSSTRALPRRRRSCGQSSTRTWTLRATPDDTRISCRCTKSWRWTGELASRHGPSSASTTIRPWNRRPWRRSSRSATTLSPTRTRRETQPPESSASLIRAPTGA